MSHDHLHFPDHHGDHQQDEEDGGPPLTWELDNVELVTVGVDVGSSTSLLVFSKLHLQRLAQSLSSRFVVVGRETLHRSEILLTPFEKGDRIDAGALRAFVTRSYAAAGLDRGQVDTGAVILTGVALERTNARAVADLFADTGGRFVCASAGENLEAILAAHGSGALALSRRVPGRRIHLDVGGGTTKLALLEGGEVLETVAVAAGGRLVAVDAGGRVSRIEWAAAALARELGIPLRLGAPLEPGAQRRLAAGLAARVLETLHAFGAGPGAPITCSGGVSEYVYGREQRDFGDLAIDLAAELRGGCAASGIEIEAVPGGEGIRATVIGASQFTVQLSGNTVHVSDPRLLPLRNLPVVRPRLEPGEPSETALAAAIGRAFARLDLRPADGPVALAVPWSGEPRHGSLRALAGGVAAALAPALDAGVPIVLALDADIARSLGAILGEELGVTGGVVCIDGVELMELDYVDIGEVVLPAGVVPVVVKSLAFGLSPAPPPAAAMSSAAGGPGAPPARRAQRSRTDARA